MAERPFESPRTESLVGGASQTTPFDIETMPPGIPYIVGNEAAERFSFYGMKALLPTFMTMHLLNAAGQPAFLNEEQATAAVSWFNAATYTTPLLGAIFADWLLGKYRSILFLSLFYCLGHGVLTLLELPPGSSVEPWSILVFGLALLAIGSGGMKPCVTSHVGDQFGRRNQHLLPRVYSWFYFSINIGAVISQTLTPWLLDRYGPGWAFGVPGVMMAIATLVFWLGRNRFVHIPPAGKRFWKETISRDGLRAILNLLPLLLFVSMFWSLFDQASSKWVLQATKLNCDVNLHIGPLHIEKILPAQIQAVNPFLVLFMIPLFTYLIYPVLGRFFEVSPLRKIGIGLFITVIAFAIAGWIQIALDGGAQPHIAWQVIAYIFMTAAEIMISITVLEFFYTQSPRRMKSFIMSLCMVSVAIGNVFTGVVNIFIQNEDGTSKLPGASYYWFFTAAMAITAVLYVVWSQFYRGQTYIQGEEEPLPV